MLMSGRKCLENTRVMVQPIMETPNSTLQWVSFGALWMDCPELFHNINTVLTFSGSKANQNWRFPVSYSYCKKKHNTRR